MTHSDDIIDVEPVTSSRTRLSELDRKKSNSTRLDNDKAHIGWIERLRRFSDHIEQRKRKRQADLLRGDILAVLFTKVRALIQIFLGLIVILVGLPLLVYPHPGLILMVVGCALVLSGIFILYQNHTQ